jgi:Flp pilus assembly protein TadB
VTYCEGVRRPGWLRRGSGREPVYQITGARRGVREDVDARSRRYLISMGVRTLCFVLAVVTHGWLRWTFVVLALILPYMAVVLANTGRERSVDIPDTDRADDRRALGPTER